MLGFIATWLPWLILAIQYQHPWVIYIELFMRLDSSSQYSCLGPTEETAAAADMNLVEQRCLVVSLLWS